MHVDENELKEFLTDADLVSKSDFEDVVEAAEDANTDVGDILVNRGYLSPDELRRAQAYVLGIPFVDLEDRDLDFDTLSLIPEPIARTRNIIAFNQRSENELEVAMLDTADLEAIDSVKKKVGMKVLPRLTSEASIKHALRQYQKTLKEEFGDIIRRESASLREATDRDNDGELDAQDLKEMAEDLPVVRVVDALIKHAIVQNASDIHIEPRDESVLVRYRIDGILHDAMSLPKSSADSIVARVKVLADLKLDEKRLPQDGRFRVQTDNEDVSLRVSVMPTYFGEKVVMRLLRGNVDGFTLEGLGFHGTGLEAVHAATRQRTGMILTTGPTGSGKTTTLYTLLDILNTPEVNISTVEDPIEYQMDRINQTQVRPNIGFTFAKGLRSLVRQDPDILMVGEIRDGETASLAVNAALTGHLVLSTLHTNSAAGTIPRLTEMGAKPFLLTSTLEVVIGQRLVRRLCSDCEPYTPDAEQMDQLREHADLDRVFQALKDENVVDADADWGSIQFYHPNESGDCPEGYSGRLGIYEVMPVSSGIRECIANGATADEVEQQARSEGMLTMLEDGIFKAAQGMTSIEEVLRVVSE